ncbi:zinc-ribbon domain-containing protein, partial [Streptomyces sp. WAC05950]
MHRPSGCPSCAEPLEEGDRFCGLCGYALTSSPPAASTDHPTIPIPPAPPAPAAPPAPPAPVQAAPAAGGYGMPAP